MRRDSVKKDFRAKKIRSRKNFLPTLIITVFLWAGLALLIYFTDPFSFGTLVAFFLLIFLAILFTISTAFVNTRRGVIVATSLTLFLILRYFGVGNILNLILILGLAIASELYSTRR